MSSNENQKSDEQIHVKDQVSDNKFVTEAMRVSDNKFVTEAMRVSEYSMNPYEIDAMSHRYDNNSSNPRYSTKNSLGQPLCINYGGETCWYSFALQAYFCPSGKVVNPYKK